MDWKLKWSWKSIAVLPPFSLTQKWIFTPTAPVNSYTCMCVCVNKSHHHFLICSSKRFRIFFDMTNMSCLHFTANFKREYAEWMKEEKSTKHSQYQYTKLNISNLLLQIEQNTKCTIKLNFAHTVFDSNDNA